MSFDQFQHPELLRNQVEDNHQAPPPPIGAVCTAEHGRAAATYAVSLLFNICTLCIIVLYIWHGYALRTETIFFYSTPTEPTRARRPYE